MYGLIITTFDRADHVGVKLRRHVPIKDTVAIQCADDRLYGFVVQHRSHATTSDEALWHGCDSLLDIDSLRVEIHRPRSTCDYSKNRNDRSFKVGLQRTGSKRSSTTMKGRWPANVVYGHHPECRCRGTIEVSTPSTYEGSSDSTNQTAYGDGMGEREGDRSKNYGNEDGKEPMPDWDCHPSCMVEDLDQQSFEDGMHSAGHAREGGDPDAIPNVERAVASGLTKDIDKQYRFGDEGGASRFYYCGGDREDVIDYLKRGFPYVEEIT